MMTRQLDTPAQKDNVQVTDQVNAPVKKEFWQVVTDILDNPFIPACERDRALLDMGYKVMLSDVIKV